jgi:hypothetical protein
MISLDPSRDPVSEVGFSGQHECVLGSCGHRQVLKGDLATVVEATWIGGKETQLDPHLSMTW